MANSNRTDKHEETKPESKPETKAEVKAAESEPAPLPTPPEPSFRDHLCIELNRHRSNCDCKGEGRKPFA